MRPLPDSIQQVSPWHLDCRIESELPDDSIVGKRFLLHTAAAVFATMAILLACWVGYRYRSMNEAISDWDVRIEANQRDLVEIERLREVYATESAKIDYAYAIMQQDIPAQIFISRIARTRPENMTIDSIESTATGVVLRGSLREQSELASRSLGQYRERLRVDEQLARYFREVNIGNLERRLGPNLMSFELIFTKR